MKHARLQCLPILFWVVLQAGVGAQSDRLDFGTLTLDAPLEHTFVFRNDSSGPIEVSGAQLTPPLIAVRGTQTIGPGELGSIVIRLAQPREAGPFEGTIVLTFKQPTAPSRTFVVTGTLVPSLELRPAYGVYLAARRGEPASRVLDIVNHQETPLEILGVEYDGARFTPLLETVEAGRRYRVTVTVRQDAPAGRTTEMVRLRTSDPSRAVIAFPANIWIRERVYTFPDVLDLGTIRLEDLKARPGLLGRLEQTLMVYQVGGAGFQVSAGTDLSFLRLAAAPSPLGDRYQMTVSIVPEALQPGEIRGSVFITTNDSEFPKLVVPVRGLVEGASR